MHVRRLFFLIASVLWMAVIFYFSSRPDLRSSLPDVWDFVARKIAHMFEFGLLAILWSHVFDGTKHARYLAFGIAGLYALSDEWHQSFTAGRNASFADVVIDWVGVFIALRSLRPRNMKPPQAKGLRRLLRIS